MTNLGSISVTFLANTASFTGAVRVAAENLKSFGQSVQIASTASIPLQSTLGGVGSAAAMTTGNMSRLSQSAISSATNMGLLQAATAQGQTTLSSFGMNAGAAATGLKQVATNATAVTQSEDSFIKVNQRAGESAETFTKRIETGTRALKGRVPVGHEIKNSFRMMADGSLQASRTITKSNNQSILSLMSFSNMAGKIAHYISFSIGVQMVMALSRGIRSLIETMTSFQKEIVRTAGVAGRLGGAFKKTVEDIGAVSRELGRNTIFKASEAAHAMYDLASAGFDVAGAMSSVANGVDVVGPILDYAAAQQIELADATASVSRALKMFDMDLDESVSVVDTFTAAIANSFLTAEKLTDGLRYSGAMAHVLDVSLQETVAALMSLSDAGLTGAQSGQRLNMIMTKLLKPTDKAKRTLASLGLTIEDITPQTHTLAEIFQTLQAAGFGAGEAANFFRARTAGAAAALISNADAMERYKLTLLGAEGITKELAERQEETLWGAFKLLSAAVESLALDFGDLLMPVLMAVTSFMKNGVIPVLEAVVGGIKAFFDIISPLVPLIKWFGAGLLIAGAYILLYTAYTYLAAHATNMWTAALAANPFTAPIMAIGLLIAAIIGLMDTFGILGPVTEGISRAFGRLVEWIKGIIDWFNNASPAVKNLISIIFPLVGVIRVLSDVFGDAYEEERKLFNYMNKLRESSDEYRSTLDELIVAYDEQIDAQEDVDDLLRSENNNIEKLTAAKAKAAKASENVIEKEKKFYSASAQLMKVIASLTEGLNLFVEAMGKVNVAQDKIVSTSEDILDINRDILKLNNDLVDSTNRYGEGSQEVTDIESELYKKHKDLLDADQELIDLGVEEQDEIDSRVEEYNKLGEAEKQIADIAQDVLDNEGKKKDAEVKMLGLLAKKNVLLSTRNNFERYFNERVNLLRDAEQKLYDIELKIYKLRHGAVDTYRELFKALTGQGIVTDDLIETYKNMEITQGNALKEHVEYSQVLNTLNDSNRRSVTEWTEAYVAALDEGMSENDAYVDANKKMGISIDNISQLTGDGIKEILEYAHARHLANEAENDYRGIAVGLTNDIVDSGQASVDLATALAQILSNENALETETDNLSRAQKTLDDNIYGLIGSTGRLLQNWLEFGEVGEDIGKITVEMVKDMDLVNDVGADQESILRRLNSFYSLGKTSLEDYSHAEIVAALSAMKLAEDMEGVSASTITKEDIVDQLPIDDFSEFGNIAINVVNDLETQFDSLATEIGTLAAEIDRLVEVLDILAGSKFPVIPEPPTTKWQDFLDMMQKGMDNITAGRGVDIPVWMKALSPLAWVPDIINYALTEAKKGMISLAGGITRTHGPTNALIGEAGAEAVVPLEGANRRFGKQILDEIIPKYFPDILANNKASLQRGGEVNLPRTSTEYLRNTEESTEIHVHGDINVYNPNNMDEFMDEFLEQIGKRRRLKI